MTQCRVLIADDSKTDRLILQTLLKKQGFPVYVAQNGREAIDIFHKHRPDIVLLDAIMPEVDGFEAATEIKRLSGEVFTPIIFLTSLSDAPSLARCLEVGGNDFLTKPYNRIILKAKIEAFYRMRELNRMVCEQRDKIQGLTDEMIAEQHQARKIFDNIAHRGCLSASNICFNVSPLSIFNGDILLAAEKPLGGMHIFLGDFTGHGLPAAIGAMPVAEIFYGMTLKGFAMEEVLREINSRLGQILPTGSFCCAFCADIDFQEQRIRTWNGGLPEGYLIRCREGITAILPSQHLPLGIVDSKKFATDLQVRPFTTDDLLIMASDGVIESENSRHEMFGPERLERTLRQGIETGAVFDTLYHALASFVGDDQQTDDISFVQVSGARPKDHIDAQDSGLGLSKPLDWSISYKFHSDSLRNFDPLPLIVQPLMEVHALRGQRSRVFTILSELYSNGLDHGVLGLSSAIKTDAEGFARYYALKSERLKALDSDYITVTVKLRSSGDSGQLSVRVEDSGAGFDYESKTIREAKSVLSGRGLPLLRSLCDELEFFGSGNQVEIILYWGTVTE